MTALPARRARHLLSFLPLIACRFLQQAVPGGMSCAARILIGFTCYKMDAQTEIKASYIPWAKINDKVVKPRIFKRSRQKTMPRRAVTTT